MGSECDGVIECTRSENAGWLSSVPEASPGPAEPRLHHGPEGI